ncbi:hypothetical protein NDI54_05910 [Haloarcula sp. S1AR25-5A]|uniref:Uncharacterized protein n=1 Tax=Haloarcula terrestris TaxID=2950533 RepID=A0AAE4EWS5_9EURY|nr:hypothetical protein [Haloarcula terrestris]MDS0220889.1 hypothetical protein [Haloarcula terrestris]
MTRRSKRELERAVDDLDDSPKGGVSSVTFREWRADETGDPVECVNVTECDIDGSGGRELVWNDIVVPTDWERDR